MYYFIPAWYNPDRIWYDETKEWTYRDEKLQFDDSVNQIRVFHQNYQDVSILVLNYSPNLRSFLHQKDLFEVPHHSIFDELQGIHQLKSGRPIDWRTLSWPDRTEFIYSPFTITAYLDNQLYGRIHIASGGHLYKIDLFEEKDVLKERLVFDDRGFLSSILYFKEGNEDYQDYLNDKGDWCLREYLGERAHEGIDINRQTVFSVKEEHYSNWETLISEIVFNKFTEMTSDDHIVVAAQSQNNLLFKDTPVALTYSFFQDRFAFSEQNRDLFKSAEMLVVDNQSNFKKLSNSFSQVDDRPNILQVSPFDTRFELGMSVRRKELEIYLFADTIDWDQLSHALKKIFTIMSHNGNMTLTVGTFKNDFALNQKLKNLIQEYIDKYIPVQESLLEMGPPVKEAEEEEPRAKLEVLQDENDLIVLLKGVRLLIDLGIEPDLFHQIAGISSGIPQINTVISDYVSHKENGYVIDGMNQLESAINYYFKGLTNWNTALVHSIEKIAENTGPTLIHKWEKQLKG